MRKMKKRLEKLLKAKMAQRSTLNASMIECDNKEERAAIGETLTKLGEEIAELEAMLAEADEPRAGEGGNDEGGNGGEGRGLNVLASMQQRNGGVAEDGTASVEYRNAFKNFIANGNREELRAAAGNTTTSDNVGSVIPTNLLNQIIEKIESVGTIYKLVTHTAYPVGQTIPREALKPVATWVGVQPKNSGEGLGSTVGKGTTLDTAIVFAHFKLRCEVAMTEEVSTMALSSFEALFVKNVSLAMIRAIEFAIVEGTGVGMPTGILNAAAPTGQALEIAKAGKLDYKTLCDAEAAIPAQYEAGAKWCMTKKTFMSFVGMVDSVGQPIARVNYGVNGKPERVLMGRDVVIYEPQAGSKLGNYADTVSADTLVAFIYDFGDYTLNTNYDLGIQHKIDWDNEDHRTKAVAAYDGKPVDNGSLVTLTKKSA
jgi:HK97 family phage major capsid protein